MDKSEFDADVLARLKAEGRCTAHHLKLQIGIQNREIVSRSLQRLKRKKLVKNLGAWWQSA